MGRERKGETITDEGSFFTGTYYGFVIALILWLALAIVLALIFGCSLGAFRNINPKIAPSFLEEMNSLYSPWSEKAFCLGPSGPYNILEGGWMSVEMPVCERLDIPFHTHPWWAEDFPNFNDIQVWEEYSRIYGNKRFGILFGVGNFQIYERK